MSGPGQTDRAIGGDTPRITRSSDLAAAGRQDSPARSGDALYEDAQELEREQQAMLETAPVEQGYQEALAGYVQAKHDQVERIEDRLENLIEQQQARLQQTFAAQPGLLSRGSAKAGVVRRNPRNFRQPSSSPATSASRSMNLPSVWKV